MKPQIHNLRRRIDARGAWLFVPALAAMLAAVGVTTPRAVELAHLRAGAESAEIEARECARLRRDVNAFQEVGGSQRAQAAIAAVRAALPGRCSTSEMHSAVRLAAAPSGLELARIQVSEAQALPLEGEGDVLGQRSIEIMGHASFSGPANLVRSLGLLGYPARVQSLTLTRDAAMPDRFEVHAVLILFHGVERPAALPEASSESSQEQ